MTDTVLESNGLPVNSEGEVVLSYGTGDRVVVGLLPPSMFPVNLSQQLVVSRPYEVTEWQTPVLEDGWINKSGFIPTRYRKVNDEVQIVLNVTNGTATTIFILPAGFRPSAKLGFSAQVHDKTMSPDFGHMLIQADGQVIFEHHGSLDNHSVHTVMTFWTDL